MQLQNGLGYRKRTFVTVLWIVCSHNRLLGLYMWCVIFRLKCRQFESVCYSILLKLQLMYTTKKYEKTFVYKRQTVYTLVFHNQGDAARTL